MKRRTRTLAVCAFACMAIATLSTAQKKTTVDLSGSWQIVHQTGDKLEGTFGNRDWPIVGATEGRMKNPKEAGNWTAVRIQI